ncbi:gamma-glutamylcyclotransferase family protein [Halobaculum limi]|uniref:gamma-glutamylcyclotransferase family protein n=1 Tax=Halobaculum limi TaxID=3031916 RepID=UPI0024056C7F|nr:gamma-glutamylcyclotransferase family protein [Halobaculum sp. YSMS11]
MDVFVYGTLTEPTRVREVLDSFAFVGAATLRGLRVVEGRYPTLAPPESVGEELADSAVTHAANGIDDAVGGRLLRTDEVDALDAYERVDDDLYVRVSVPLFDPDGDRAGTVAVYVGDPDRLAADATWPGDGPFPRRVRRAVDELDVTVERQVGR